MTGRRQCSHSRQIEGSLLCSAPWEEVGSTNEQEKINVDRILATETSSRCVNLHVIFLILEVADCGLGVHLPVKVYVLLT